MAVISASCLTDPVPREPIFTYSPTCAGGLDRSEFPCLRLTVEILSGQHIPRPNNSEKGEVIDPYVEVKVRGHQDDFSNENNRHETQPVRNNGFSPSWREKFEFYLTAPEIAFLEFKVRDEREMILVILKLTMCTGEGSQPQ